MDEDILFRSLTGRATAAEESAVRAWREAARDNERQYRELGRLLQVSARADSLTRGRTKAPDSAVLIAASEPALGDPVGRQARPIAGRSWIPWVAGAAAAVLAAAVAWNLRGAAPLPVGFRVSEFLTGHGETATISLTDGTVVRLAERSKLKLRGDGGGREVALQGRAYFAVAKDRQRPFQIQTSAGEVAVVGTRFDLQAENEDLRLLVVEGQVRLSAGGGKAEVRAGEMGRLIKGTPVPVVRVPDVAGMVDWKGNFLAFQDTPLEEVAREIERQFGIGIEIRDARLAKRTLTGWFADWSREEVMEAVCGVANARCEMGETRIVMWAR
jgi:transmembrane sensor